SRADGAILAVDAAPPSERRRFPPCRRVRRARIGRHARLVTQTGGCGLIFSENAGADERTSGICR
ncbi:hypothetical protein, partial [Burkholderia oklahomensis]|uniref:hypothetical protein n=1 Tax=Burkholderia oklahomensis TaxID=342113 RepID=UPI001E2E493C